LQLSRKRQTEYTGPDDENIYHPPVSTMTAPDAQGPQGDLRWENGVPVSGRFDDPYYSRENGLEETRHVFIEGCRLSAMIAARRTSIAELGFGTGLNFCATLAHWRHHAPPDLPLDYTAFELYPMQADAIDRALAVWPELDTQRAALVSAWRPEGGTVEIGPARLTLVIGDARETVPAWSGLADAWYLDGFAPSRNPQMWEPGLLGAVGRASTPDAIAATYSVAGVVRRGLEAAGFTLERLPGYGRKREMLRAFRTNPDRGTPASRR